MKDIDEVLKSLINHKITITYTSHNEPTLRETDGILKEFTNGVIHLICCSNFGEEEHYFLNRHGCILHSIVEQGVRK